MATAKYAPNDSDFVISDPAEAVHGEQGIRSTSPNLDETDRTAVKTSGSQASSSKISNVSYQSETSTLAHEQTPFIDFKLQVLELCHLLWPSTPKITLPEQSTTASGHRFSGFLESRKLLRRKSSSPVTSNETSKDLLRTSELSV